MTKMNEKNSLFRGVSGKVLEEVLALSFKQTLNLSEIVFHQGEPAQTLFLISTGRIKLVEINENGEEVVLRFVGPGEITAAVSVLSNTAYPASAHVVQAGEALCWSGNVLRNAMRKYPELAINALDIVVDRLIEVQARFLELRTERVEQRIARTLLRLLKRGGKKVKGGIQIDFPITRQDIAEHSATTLYTVSRTISTWEKRGWVKGGREKIIVSDLHALVTISEDLQ